MAPDEQRAPEPRRTLGPSPWAHVLVPLVLILGLGLLLSLSLGPTRGETAPTSPVEAWLKWLVSYVAAGAEISAALVIGLAILRSRVAYVRHVVTPVPASVDATEAIRLRLGRVLALGLELTVASDILRTAVAPTRQDIVNLGAIVLLRTLLNYFLEREIRHGEEPRR
jgi:uncharacterized membrane protein